MKSTTSTVILFVFALAAPAFAVECSTTQLSSCLLAATPSGLVPQETTTQLACGDQACVCSAMSLQFDCYRTYCPDDQNLDSFNSEIAAECGTRAPTGAVTGTGEIAASTTAPPTTTATLSTSTTSATSKAPTSTSSGNAGEMVVGNAAGGILAVFFGVLANL